MIWNFRNKLKPRCSAIRGGLNLIGKIVSDGDNTSWREKMRFHCRSACMVFFGSVLLGTSILVAAAGLEKDIIIVLDNSGSMKINDPKFLTRQVVYEFLSGLSDDSKLGVVIFDEKADLVAPLTFIDSEEKRQPILSSLSKVTYAGKLTDSPAGIERAIYELKKNGRENTAKAIVFLTDGIVDTGNKALDIERSRWLRDDLALECAKQNIRIFGIAFTEMADYHLIQSLGQKTGGAYFRALTAVDISKTFKEIIFSLQGTQGVVEKENITVPPVEAPATIKEVGITPPAVQLPPPNAVPPPEGSGEKSDTFFFFGLMALCLGLGAVGYKIFKKRAVIPKAWLYDINSVTKREFHPIEHAVTTVGRSLENNIVIDENHVSAKHAQIEWRSHGFYLMDLRSTNGTFLNGERINGEAILTNGDNIKLDTCTFEFQTDRFAITEVRPVKKGVVTRKGSSDKPR